MSGQLQSGAHVRFTFAGLEQVSLARPPALIDLNIVDANGNIVESTTLSPEQLKCLEIMLRMIADDIESTLSS